jgi:hypothetical protein
MKTQIEKLNFASDGEDYFRFKEAVRVTEKQMSISNTSITFIDEQSEVLIDDTRAAFLINVGVNFHKLEK